MKIINSLIPYLPAPIRKNLVRALLPDFYRSIPGITFREATTPSEQETCLQLVNDVYVDAGYVTGPVGFGYTRKIPQHDNPETMIFMATGFNQWQKEIPIYTASLFPDGPMGLPLEIGFKNQVDALRQQGHRLVEIGCLASHKDYRKKDKRIPMIMNHLLMKTSIHRFLADDMLITIHPKYMKIYEDILLFEPIKRIKNFSYVNNNPAVALRLNLNTAPARFKKVYSNMPAGKNLYQFFFGE